MLIEAGHAKRSISVLSLVDTNILVYRFDPRFPQKQRIAADVLRRGVMNETLRIPHQALMEFVAVVTRVHRGRAAIAQSSRRKARGRRVLNSVYRPVPECCSVSNSIARCGGISIVLV